MQATIMDDGNLKITADTEDREGISWHYAEGGDGFNGADSDIVGELRDAGFERVEPEWIAALTDAPIFSDEVEWPEDGDDMPMVRGRVWWYPSYQVLDPWEELGKDGEVIFKLAPEVSPSRSAERRPRSTHGSPALSTPWTTSPGASGRA